MRFEDEPCCSSEVTTASKGGQSSLQTIAVVRFSKSVDPTDCEMTSFPDEAISLIAKTQSFTAMYALLIATSA